MTEKEVLAAGPQPYTMLETTVVTLAHLALHSEKIELEVFRRLILLGLTTQKEKLVLLDDFHSFG